MPFFHTKVFKNKKPLSESLHFCAYPAEAIPNSAKITLEWEPPTEAGLTVHMESTSDNRSKTGFSMYITRVSRGEAVHMNSLRHEKSGGIARGFAVSVAAEKEILKEKPLAF